MFAGGVILWEILVAQAAGRKNLRSNTAMDDPLDRAEWRGLLFIVPLLRLLTSSGWSRNSAE